MGMYTGLKLKVQLKKETRSEWEPPLTLMLGSVGFIEVKEKLGHIHPLFNQPRAHYMLCCGSAYLDREYPSDSTLSENILIVSSNFKNYNSERDLFLDWLSPYVEKLEYGFTRYEENDVDSLIELANGKLRVIKNE